MVKNFKSPVLSAVAFFWTLCVLSVGYSAYVSNYPATATAGTSQLSATEWNKMVSALQSLDTNLSAFTVSGGNVGIGVAPNTKLSVNGNISAMGYGLVGKNLWTAPVTGAFIAGNNGSNDGGYGLFYGSNAINGTDDRRGNVDIGSYAVGWTPGKINFLAYNGTGWATNMTILSNGYVWIWMPAPSSKLHVDGSIGATGWVWAGCETACSDVASGYAIMYADGRWISTVGWTTNSDIRIKKDIRPIGDSIEKLKKINGVYYKLKEGDWTDKIGVIAQEVESVFPEIVSETESGIKTVNYDKLVAPLIEAVKVQQSRLDVLEKENEALKRQMDALRSEMLDFNR